MGIDFKYHLQLYVTHSSWINVILPIIILIIRSYRDVTKPCPLACFVQHLLQLIQLEIYQFIPYLLVVLVIALVVFVHSYTYSHITYHH